MTKTLSSTWTAQPVAYQILQRTRREHARRPDHPTPSCGCTERLIHVRRSASGSTTHEPKACRKISRRCADKSDQDGAYGQFTARCDERQPIRRAWGPAGRPQRLPGDVRRVCREQQAVTMHDQEADRDTCGQHHEPAGG